MEAATPSPLDDTCPWYCGALRRGRQTDREQQQCRTSGEAEDVTALLAGLPIVSSSWCACWSLPVAAHVELAATCAQCRALRL
jgi:hypothetical protein